jgi:hypothetical protein
MPPAIKPDMTTHIPADMTPDIKPESSDLDRRLAEYRKMLMF